VIDWLGGASIRAVARHSRLSWDQVDRVMQAAVERGLARRKPEPVEQIGIDETSRRRGHRCQAPRRRREGVAPTSTERCRPAASIA
jgi:transposase